MGIQFAQQVETRIPSTIGLKTQSHPNLDILRPVIYPPTPADAAAMAILGSFGFLGTHPNPQSEPMAFIKQGVVTTQFSSPPFSAIIYHIQLTYVLLISL